MVGHVMLEMFRWPDGIVVGNLIASALWATPALLHLHRKIDRHRVEQAKRHREMMTAMGSLNDGYAATISAVSAKLGEGS